ncbi:hypothetical protein CF319_g2076 [Tilletia indica]|nr:hypothetical protein CF319_g2076 [Tilletia indica]
MYSSPQYTFLAPSGDQDPIPVRPTYPPQADRVRGPRQPSDHRLSIHAARLSDQSQSSRPSFHQSHSYASEGRSPPITRESSQGQAPQMNPPHHHPQQHHSAHREQHHHQPAHRDERHRPISSHSAFDPLNYHGPSAYNHLSLPLASRDDGPKRPEDFDPDHKQGAYRTLHLSGTDSRLSQQQIQYDQARRRLPWFLRPWQTAFEAPSKANIALLLFCCAVSYTLVWIVPSLITRRIEMTLYWARAVVNAATSIAGFIITLALTEIAHRILYSAIWTAVILEEDMTLNDLDQIADRIGVISGLRLLWIKFRAGTKRFAGASRRAEQSDKASIHGSRSRFRRATWGIEVPASLGLLLLAGAFGFSADRTLKISVELRAQNDIFDAISVGGDLSAADVTGAASIQPFFDDFVRTWTLQSTAALKLPSTVKLALPGQSDQFAYFTEVLPDNFLPDFEGYGSFSNDTRTSSNYAAVAQANSSWKPDSPDSWTTIIGGGGTDSDGEENTVLRNVRWPRWGVQARCQRLQNLGRYFVPDISQTPDATVADRLSVLFLTREILSSVLATLDVPLPSTLQTARNLNMSYGDLNNVLPAGLNAADVAIAHPFYANGVAQAFFSRPIMAEDEINPDASVPDAYKNTPGSAGRGWSSLEIVLIRLKPELAGPGAQFGMVANVTDNNGNFGDVGFDVGVCVERFDPFLVEVFQGKSIQSSRIISQAADFTSQKGMPRSSQVSAGSATNLNSTGKFAAYSVAHDNARNALLKDNGRDASWVPNPTLTSMSSGAEGGPAGYGRLDPERLADMLASADTRLLLPYLVGRGKVEARSYDLKQIARVSCIVSWLNIVFGVIIGCGLLGIFFVPRLPAGLPRRSTSPISWLVAFSGAGALRIGSTPAGAVLSGRSSANPDRKSASGSFASFHHLSHDPSRLSTMSGGTAAADDDEQRLLRGEGFHPRLADGRMLVGGAWITLDEIEKRLGKKPVSYALPDNTVRPYGGESMVGTPWDSQPVLTYRPPS